MGLFYFWLIPCVPRKIGNYDDRTVLLENYRKLIKVMPVLMEKGLAAAIYTQTTDVEGEVNGLMTYDREIIKMEPAEVKKVHSGVLQKQF